MAIVVDKLQTSLDPFSFKTNTGTSGPQSHLNVSQLLIHGFHESAAST